MSVFSPPAPSPNGGAASSSSDSSSLASEALIRPPLELPAALNQKTFYLSPIANPDLVLALIIPGHPLYSGHALPHSSSETHLAREAPTGSTSASGGASGRLAHFFGSAANTVTNTAASAVGVKNQLELNKVKLKLVPRTLPTVSSSPLSFALNQRWVMRGDGCVYSCVEQEGGALYRLGTNKNQMIRVKSKEDGGEGSAASGEQLPGVTTPTSPGAEGAASTTARDISSTRSGLVAAGKASSATEAGDSSASGKSQLISVTTARGDTVVCPRRWEVQKPVAWGELKESIAISGMHVVIEDTEAAANQNFGMVGLLSRAASAAQHGIEAIAAATVGSSGSAGSGGKDTSCLLVIKDICCGNLDCELERIEEGATCGFKQTRADDDDEKDAKGKSPKSASTSSTSPTAGSGVGVSTLATRQGPSIKQIWRVESDFSIWLSSLSRAVSTEYGVTRKLQKIEAERAARREATPKPQEHTPLRLTIDYEYASIWSTEGTKAAQPLSIWRPKAPHGVYFGDYIVQGLGAPAKKESLVVSCAQGGPLHRALVRPIDFELVWMKKKGKNGPLYVWAPVAPPGVDALALGHIATAGASKEEAAKPSITCGVVMVLREYLKDSGHALSHQLWADTNLSGGPPGSFWRPGGHSHTFFCNPGSHNPPSGSYYMLLEPQESPEIAPLLRPMETSNAGWDPVWDDRGTLAKMDVSVWRPKLEKSFVRFGDQIVRGHSPPSNLAVVARDHPAFRRPKAFELATKIYRGARKCYVFRPIPPSEEYIALGFAVSASKDDPPLPDVLRCVHRDALIPLGVLKQMWVEHHAGMMSTLTLGVTTMLTLSRDYPVNMLWKNRSLNTFIAVQNTHARPQQFAAGAVYRLTMTANELAHTVAILETHARWVLESLYGALANLAQELENSDFMELSVSPAQACTLFQAVKGVFKYLRAEGAGGAPAFNISAPFQQYLSEYESTRLRVVEKAFKRHLYQLICEDISDHEYTLGTLDECWDLMAQLSDVHRTYDEVAAWTPPCTAKFPSSQLKSLPLLILDDQIGKEIFERFLKAFPPRISERGMDDVEDQDDDEELPVILSGSAAAAAVATVSGAKGASPARPSISGANSSAADASIDAKLKALPASSDSSSSSQLDETQEILAKLQTLADELHLVRRLTESMELRKRYLEWYQTYLTHVLLQEFPLSGSTARLGSTGAKLGMASLRAVVGWACLYIEVVEQALLEGDREEARSVLSKMDDVVDRLMDVHDDMSKNKILAWVSNLLRMEERAPAELREEMVEDAKHNKIIKYFFFTSGPTDLFGNINMLFESQSQKDHPTQRLRNRPLARIALVHVHVLTYYQQVQTQFFKQLRAVADGTTFQTVSGKGAPPVDTPHAGSLNKPYAYVLAQINNTAQYQSMVENFQDEVLQLLGADDAPDELMSSLEDAFALCGEEFQTLALAATEVLIRHVSQQLEAPFAQMFLEKTWGTEEAWFHTNVLGPLDVLCSHFAPNIQPSICATHLMRETARNAIRAYIRAFTLQLKGPLPASGVMSPAAVADRIRGDAQDLRDNLAASKNWGVLESCEKWLAKMDLLAEFIASDADFLKLHVEEIKKLYQGDAEFTPALMLYTLLSLRSDVESDDRKRWLAPYAAEVKAIEESRRPKLPKVSPSDVGKFFSKITTSATSSSSTTPPLDKRASVGGASSPDSSLGEEYGLEVHLLRGSDLAVKDVTTSDPYVNILLLRPDGSRLAKQGSKVVPKCLNPQWNETFSKWRVSDVAQLDRIRFEVFDKDFIGKDFMGQAEVSVGDIRSKQLLERKTVLTGCTDFTQEWMAFHLKLAQNPGKKNEGSDLVSGHIDVKIRYFKTSGAHGSVHPVAHPVAKVSISTSASAAADDMDFEPEDAGQTGSKRPPPAADSAGVGSAAPAHPPSPALEPEAPTSSTHVLEAAASAPLWSDITSQIKLKRPSLVAGSPAAPKHPSAFRRQATLRGQTLHKKDTFHLVPPPSSTTAARRRSTSRGSRRGSSAAAGAGDDADAAVTTATSAANASSPRDAGQAQARKLKKASDKDNFNIFKLF